MLITVLRQSVSGQAHLLAWVSSVMLVNLVLGLQMHTGSR